MKSARSMVWTVTSKGNTTSPATKHPETETDPTACCDRSSQEKGHLRPGYEG